MADDLVAVINQVIGILQAALPSQPKPENQVFRGTVIGVQKGDPYGTFWVVRFFDRGSPPELHVFNFNGGSMLPDVVTVGAELQLTVAPPVVAGGYSTLVRVDRVSEA